MRTPAALRLLPVAPQHPFLQMVGLTEVSQAKRANINCSPREDRAACVTPSQLSRRLCFKSHLPAVGKDVAKVGPMIHEVQLHTRFPFLW